MCLEKSANKNVVFFAWFNLGFRFLDMISNYLHGTVIFGFWLENNALGKIEHKEDF